MRPEAPSGAAAVGVKDEEEAGVTRIYGGRDGGATEDVVRTLGRYVLAAPVGFHLTIVTPEKMVAEVVVKKDHMR